MKNQKHTVRKVIDYIEEHLEEELNLEQIAEHAGYSRFHLNRIFMEETGGTIHKYVQERRLTMAAEKLVDTDMDITQIAYDAGYQSQQAFSLAFKQVYLCPPGAYRKRGIYQPAKSFSHGSGRPSPARRPAYSGFCSGIPRMARQ